MKTVLTRLIIISALVFSATLALSACVYAENETGEATHSIDSYVRFMPSQKAEAMPGKIEVIEADSEYSCEFKAFGKLPVKFSLGQKYIGIKNSTAIELPAHLVSLGTDFETTLPFLGIQDTYIRFGLSPSFFGNDWSFTASEFRMPFRSFAIYVPDDKWTLLVGIAVYPDFEREVYPILGFIYKHNDKLTFNIVPKRPNVSYEINKKLTVFTEGGNSFAEYEVRKDTLKSAVLRYRELHLGAGVKYKFNEFIQGSISGGGIFNRSLKYRDSLGKVNIKDGFYTEIRLEARI